MGIPIIGIYRDVTSLYLSHHNYAALEGNRKVSVKYMVQASNPTSSVMVMVLVPTPLCEWGGFSPPALWEWGVSCMYVCMYVLAQMLDATLQYLSRLAQTLAATS